MDWSIILAGLMIAVSLVLGLKYIKLKKDVLTFEGKLERNMDALLSGREPDTTEEVEDTLFGKCSVRMNQIGRIWKQKEEENRASREELKSLISDISHQTRTPLSNMKAYLSLLREETQPDRQEEFLNSLDKQADKLEFLLQSMVKMSRLETGLIQVQMKTSDLCTTIRKAIEEIVPAAAGKQIALYVECPDKLWLLHDSKWTEEAIFNVLDNAVKYTQRGGEIHISVTRQEIFTKISIQDNGKGIALERQAEIFKRFYREPEVHEKPGIGIGLYLTRKILELQNGYIEVRSQEGEGSVFCLYLPESPEQNVENHKTENIAE